MAQPGFGSPEVARYFEAAPAHAREGLLALRDLILDCAATTEGVGRVEEALRWGQPAYLTPETRAGSTLRLGATPGGFALYAHCRTSIIGDFARAFPGLDRIETNRAVHFDSPDQVEPARHGQLIRHALTYHRRR